jgi:hypothetical protein
MVRRSVNNEFERIWKEVVMALFEVLFWELPRGTEETTKTIRIFAPAKI